MPRRPWLLALLICLLGLALPAMLFAQMESGDRGIPPIDSSGTLEVTGIHVDVGGKDAQEARFAGWRIAQREGFRRLWAKTHKRPLAEAPRLPDSTLDGLVSSIIIQREQIGPTRYIADIGILFDRARSAALLGMSGETVRSAPMLLIPVIVTAGTEMSVELRNPWQRAWAEFRTSQSPIDYVRVSGVGIDPLLVNAAQTWRPGRGWWRNVIDFYGAADIVVAEVLLHRAYPGGPATARFAAFHGPDRQLVGTFGLRVRSSAAVPAMMREGVERMDRMLTEALAAGRLERDVTLDIPEPPPPPEEEAPPPPPPAGLLWNYQVQIVASDVNVYNFAVAHLRTSGGVERVEPVLINPSGTSYVTISYRGDLANLRSALVARGWNVERNGFVLRMSAAGAAPPPLPPPPARPAVPPPAQPPTQPPTQPQPQPQPPPAGTQP